MNEFTGFPSPTRNFFSLPNEMINIISHIKNLAELKVIIYVIRHTWGFHEYGIAKAISVDEFMHGRRKADGSRMDTGTGLSNHSVIDGLRAAVSHGYLFCEIDASDAARVVKSYALKMLVASEESSPPATSSPPEESSSSYEDASPLPVKKVHSSSEDSSHRSEKDTDRKTLEKDTEENQGGASAPTPPLLPSNILSMSESAKMRAIKTPHSLMAHDEPAPVIQAWDEDVEETVRRPAVTIASVTQVEQTIPCVPTGGAAPSPTTGALSPCVGSEPRAPEANLREAETPRSLTRKQQEKLNDAVKAEYWSVIEAWKAAKYTRDQRDSVSHKSGIEAMIANGVLPDDLKVKLGKLDDFQRRTFTVNKLYLDWWNNLDEAVKPVGANGKAGKNGKPAPIEDESDPYSFASILKRQAEQEQHAASA